MWYTAGAITPDFAYVLLVIVLVTLQNTYFMINVGRARKRFNVQVPQLYAVPGRQIQGDGESLIELTVEQSEDFNRIQRVHQNNIEGLATFYILMLLAGLGMLTIFFLFYSFSSSSVSTSTSTTSLLISCFFTAYPRIAAICGAVWLIGRQTYAYGYYQAAEKRRWGAFSNFGLLGLLVLNIVWIIKLWTTEN